MVPPPKGKAPTKGAKQILMENKATLSFYRNMALGSGLSFNIISLIFFYDNITSGVTFLNTITIIIYLVCYKMMCYISQPKYMDMNKLLDPGLDLNMEGGMGEHVKDIIILSAITHLLALISNYFWFLLLLVPVRAFWLLWTNILGPWFFQEAPEDAERDDKKRKKFERKMKRYQQ